MATRWFLPHGIHGFVILAVIMFAFGGLELIGIAAAETKKPETTIPKAVNQIVYRILIFISVQSVSFYVFIHGTWWQKAAVHLL